MKNKKRGRYFITRCAVLLALCICAPASFGQLATAPATPVHSDLSLLQCGNLIYAGNKSSVCFADRFLTDVTNQTNLRVNPKFCPVRLDAEALFALSVLRDVGNEEFALTQKERQQLRKYLTQGGFLLVGPGCSDEKWDKSFRQDQGVFSP